MSDNHPVTTTAEPTPLTKEQEEAVSAAIVAELLEEFSDARTTGLELDDIQAARLARRIFGRLASCEGPSLPYVDH